jgi:hypothetical protein
MTLLPASAPISAARLLAHLLRDPRTRVLSLADVAAILGCSRSEAVRARRWLVRAGWLVVEGESVGGKDGKGRTYRVDAPREMERAATIDHAPPMPDRRAGPWMPGARAAS